MTDSCWTPIEQNHNPYNWRKPFISYHFISISLGRAGYKNWRFLRTLHCPKLLGCQLSKRQREPQSKYSILLMVVSCLETLIWERFHESKQLGTENRKCQLFEWQGRGKSAFCVVFQWGYGHWPQLHVIWDCERTQVIFRNAFCLQFFSLQTWRNAENILTGQQMETSKTPTLKLRKIQSATNSKQNHVFPVDLKWT